MLRSTIRFFPKSQFPFSIFFCSPSTSAAALAVAHDEPSNPTASSSQFFPTKNEAVSKLLLFLFSTVSIKAPSITKLRGDLPLEAWVSAVNASEMESIVELLRRKKPQLALDFFFLSKNKYGFKHSMSCHLIVAHVLAGRQRLRGLKFHLQEMVKEQGSASAPALCELLQNNFDYWVAHNVVWNMLAFSYSTSEMVADALFVLSKMKDLNLQVSIRTYNSVRVALLN
nr:putative pentatricopeptide repeat-containing protein At1g13630 [Ipomoea trifida]